MLTFVDDLIINRVDLVDEGANSAAFIELFKRKEQRMNFSEILSKMKPEHASVIEQEMNDIKAELAKAKEDLGAANETISEQTDQIAKANEALATANEELEKAKEGKEDDDNDEDDPANKSTGFDETEVLKSMPEGAREAFIKMREQKEAAEEMVRKNAEEKAEAEAVAKAATLKSLPIEQSELVDIIKSSDQKVFDALTAAATAIDEAVLGEVGKSRQGNPAEGEEAWAKIEAEAEKVAKRDNITKQKAVGVVIKEQPELYNSYLKGGNA